MDQQALADKTKKDRVYWKDTPKISSVASCDATYITKDIGEEEITFTFYIWCHSKLKNVFWYIASETDLSKETILPEHLSAFKIEKQDEKEYLFFKHGTTDYWHSMGMSVNDEAEEPRQIEILRKIRFNYEAEKALLLENT